MAIPPHIPLQIPPLVPLLLRLLSPPLRIHLLQGCHDRGNAASHRRTQFESHAFDAGFNGYLGMRECER
jgi:hypothetical protein